MNKEFKVYKEGYGNFKLLSSEDISARHRRLRFAKPDDWVFDSEDVLWAIEDKDHNQTSNMVVVEQTENDDDVSLIVRNADHGFLKDMRKFEEGELFTLIASFRPIDE